MDYQLPLLYSAYAIKSFEDNEEARKICSDWINAYHATSLSNLLKIAKCNFQLRKPGSTSADGEKIWLRVNDGRITTNSMRNNPYTLFKFF